MSGSANGSKNVFKLNMQRRRQFQMKIRKISRRPLRSEDDEELGHFHVVVL